MSFNKIILVEISVVIPNCDTQLRERLCVHSLWQPAKNAKIGTVNSRNKRPGSRLRFGIVKLKLPHSICKR